MIDYPKDRTMEPIPDVLIEREIFQPYFRAGRPGHCLNGEVTNAICLKLSKSKKMKTYSKNIKGMKRKTRNVFGMPTVDKVKFGKNKDITVMKQPYIRKVSIEPQEAENRLLFWIDKIQQGVDWRDAKKEFFDIFGIKNAKDWRDKALRVLDLYIVNQASDIKNMNLLRLDKILKAAYDQGDYKLALSTIDLINKTAGIYQQNSQSKPDVTIETKDGGFKFSFGGMNDILDKNKIEEAEIVEINE